jgi:hypothetical protein
MSTSASTTPSSVATQHAGNRARLRHWKAGAKVTFGNLLRGIVHVRQSPRSWLALRVLLGFAGAALVVLPLGVWNSWLAAIVGLAMFLTAVLLPPRKPAKTVEEKATELGALMVVNGGEFQAENSRAARVRLFVGKECIWVLDSLLHPLLAIPSNAITSARAAELGEDWTLQILWNGHIAEFTYRGVSPECLAQAAEGAVTSVMPSTIEDLPRSRAAGA